MGSEVCELGVDDGFTVIGIEAFATGDEFKHETIGLLVKPINNEI